MDYLQDETLGRPRDRRDVGNSTLTAEDEQSSSLKGDLVRETREEDSTRLVEKLMRGTIPRGLIFEILLLKRGEETMKLHRRFSTHKNEEESQALERISAAWKAARKVATYTCINEYIFAEPRIDTHFYYEQVLSEARSRKQPLKLVDVGCCAGTDIRRLINDGFPASDITGIDIEGRFFNIGFALYNHTPKELSTTFVQANVLDPEFTRRFSHLRGQFDYVYSANVVHLFDHASQIAFLQALAFLVKPGGAVWGRQVAETEDSPTRSVRLPGKGERFTAVEFMRMWVAATGIEGSSLEWTSKLVPYDELRLVPDYKKNCLEWCVRMPPAMASMAREAGMEGNQQQQQK
ncbi:hypothetical protein F4802DRAFT_87795 [Xylaria palmicola]|nr:hypothetical protein F4802DRAFT_87795 [Xylaria palmicola]